MKPLRPCGVCRTPSPDGECPRHPRRGGYRPERPRYYASALWKGLRAVALAQSGYRCAYCDGYAFSGDHVVPLVQGGRSEPDNTLAACRRCNTSKGGRTLAQWVASGLAPAPAVALLAQRILDRLPV